VLHFVEQRATQRVKDLEAAVYRERLPLGTMTFAGRDGASAEVGVGHRWTDAENASWLRGMFTVPAEWAGERVGLYIEIPGCEPLLYLDGTPVQALDYNHADVLLYDPAQGGETHEFAIECYSPSRGATAEIRAADLVRVDREAYTAYYDFLAAVQLLPVLPESERPGQALRHALDAAMNALDYPQGGRGDAFYSALPTVRAVLRDGFFDRFHAAPERDPAMVCAGHSHIDLAYLWTIANTRKKSGRTFSTALRLMDEYPDFCFTQSQPQLYEYAKALYPELYAKVKERVAEGRWELTGGMWVEADCNVPSGESLIRQILYGNRFFREEFGKTTRVLWLPDVFGYSATLPQIIKGCGMEYFFTTKISWSQFNRFPQDTFLWRGIDGSEVLTHFVTAPDWHGGLQQQLYTYNGKLTASEVRDGWDEYRQKGINGELLTLFGHGDGGGGPTRQMLEIGRRLADVPGVPRCGFGRAEEFFDQLAERVKDNPHLPRWVGELYLENHRGTLTSQGNIKRANRQNEILYRNAELFATMAKVKLGALYPAETLTAGWKTLLLNQFHDILPGTCIPAAVTDSLADHEEIQLTGATVLTTALDALSAEVRTPDNGVVVFNPTDTLRPADVITVTVPNDAVRKGAIEFFDSEGEPLISQLLSSRGDGRTYLVLVPELGPLGWQTVGVGKAGGSPEASTVTAVVTPDGALLENELVRVQFNAAGEITSLIHQYSSDEEDEESLTEREVIAVGRTGNALIAFEDKPFAYDCWNIDPYYEDKPYPFRDHASVEEMRVIEKGPVRAGIVIRRRFRDSTLTQHIYLYAHSPRIEFHTEVDWQERQTLLKAEFPVAVHTTRATFDIQFGSIERPTHRNTSWDIARFEVCGHKWADLSEGDYGVSVLSECKYGWDVHDNVLRLTLLKSGTHPDPEADRGHHTFSYALLPHTGDYRNETVDEAYAFQYPLHARYVKANTTGKLPPDYSFATVDDQSLVIETVKQAEDGDGIIIRLYEAFNTRGTATLTLDFDIAEAFAVNLVEENPEPVTVEDREIRFSFRPFEIKTFLVRPRK
jgi:alpha-mannosidase